MEKKIVLTMQPSKDIDIVVNDHDGMTIGKDQRTVRADDIYNLLAYSRGDIFCVESVNTEGKDGPVLQFFTELFQEIINRLNKLSENNNDGQDEDDGEDDGVNTFFSEATPTSVTDDEELPF